MQRAFFFNTGNVALITVLYCMIAISVLVCNKSYGQVQLKTNEFLHLRLEPSSNSESLSIIPKGDTVIFHGVIVNGWFNIQHNDKIGYSYGVYLDSLDINESDKPIQSDTDDNIYTTIFLLLLAIALLFPVVAFTTSDSEKSPTVAFLLAIVPFYGFIGLHWFYMGNFGRGIAYVLFCYTFVTYILALFDAFYISRLSYKDFQLLCSKSF